jgi:hypothetical protein
VLPIIVIRVIPGIPHSFPGINMLSINPRRRGTSILDHLESVSIIEVEL